MSRTTTEERWFDADGNPLPSANGAASVEVHELVDGVPFRRTYATLNGPVPQGTPVDALDFLSDNEDQAKGSWDLYDSADGVLFPVETRGQLFRWLNIHDRDRATQVAHLCSFLELPVWDAAPEKLQGEVYGWLRSMTSGEAEAKTLEAGLETKRQRLREVAEERIVRWETALEDLLVRFYERQREVVLARLTGTKARKGTRHWNPAPTETKAIDVGQVIQPQRWTMEVANDLEELVTRIYRTTAADVDGADEGDVLDSPYVRRAVTEKVRRILSSTETRAEQVAQVILDRDASGDDLDAIVDAVRGTYDQRQIWAQTTARTETTGAVNSASLATAASIGLLTKEWLSSRDDKVRLAHSRLGGGDGQRAPIALPFLIGGFPMMYPGDPSAPADLVINCRCTMTFDDDDPGGGDDAIAAPDADLEAFARRMDEIAAELAALDPTAEEVRRHARTGFEFALLYLGVHGIELTYLATLADLLYDPASLAHAAAGVDWIAPFRALVDAVKRHAAYVAAGALILAIAARQDAVAAAGELGVPPEEAAALAAGLEAREQGSPNSRPSEP